MTQEPELVPPLADNYSSMVLLIDDQIMVCEAVRRALANEPDISLHFCTDPLRAMTVADEVKPTVILQDLVMPGVDGLHLVREYRKHASTRAVPVIVLSSKEDPATKGEAFAAGANDYLVKLPDRIELIARIRYHTRAYLDHVQRDAAYRALRESQRQLISANLELERLTRIDGLTGLGNRRYFDEYLAAEWKRAFRAQSPLSLLMIDADNFKRYNDTYGHMAGDEVLKQIARVIQSGSGRSTDLAARYGGEEFVVVLVDTLLEQSSAIAERLVQGVRELNIPHGPDHVTISVGVATAVPTADETPNDFVNAADLALFRAKSEGRNRVALHISRS
ncbi:PleD family two-component system response regulator [Mesorhizobium sp. B283B1A]|nr:PleD family two-component system response regulator [Mesorhizobium sp. B283B1A]TJV02614.1 MAG: PleD family two-component system response regulator [Mesorhizobium sp.]TJV41629.1 MAG: PleD family two-component system response regulator [Mesorhizobium sp.]UQS67705.1 PleD family two-component system response regulator [Mesorhizobium opportunistum]WJI41579.1 PleD family two-component system response regulator [Mesorhizobium opportunistum]